ncbi:MAG: sugar phosphate isomerase/epimerase family protein [Clostridia bacterium]
MKTGVSFYTFAQDVDILTACREVKKAGYDGVELVLSEEGSLNMHASDQTLREMRAMVEGEGLKISSVGAWNIWEHNMAGEDAREAQCARDIVKKQIDCAAAFGADAVLVVPGWVGTPFAPGIVRYDVAYDNAQKALFQLEPHARAAGVAMAVENVWNKLLLSPIEFRGFLDAIDSPFVGAYFDVGNIIYVGYPEQWIEILGSRIKRLHFCDCRFDQAGLGMFVDLLEGDVDFEKVMPAIRGIGYDDWITVEFLPNYKKFPYQSIINAKMSLDTILKL